MIFGHPDVRRSAALKAIKGWARTLFRAEEEDVVIANELRCTEEGCPPLEVVVALLRPGAPPLQVRVHKPAVDVNEDDIAAALAAAHEARANR
jgi:hypothetical protein